MLTTCLDLKIQNLKPLPYKTTTQPPKIFICSEALRVTAPAVKAAGRTRDDNRSHIAAMVIVLTWNESQSTARRGGRFTSKQLITIAL